MHIMEELSLDLDLKTPRILVNGCQAVIDNVKQIVLLSEESIIISHGKRYLAVHGQQLSITFLEGERMFITGIIDSAEFYGEKGPHE